MSMFCFSYLCGEYNPQTEGTMANVEFFGRIALIYKQNALLLVVERKIFTYENTSFIRHSWSAQSASRITVGRCNHTFW